MVIYYISPSILKRIIKHTRISKNTKYIVQKLAGSSCHLNSDSILHCFAHYTGPYMPFSLGSSQINDWESTTRVMLLNMIKFESCTVSLLCTVRTERDQSLHACICDPQRVVVHIYSSSSSSAIIFFHLSSFRFNSFSSASISDSIDLSSALVFLFSLESSSESTLNT